MVQVAPDVRRQLRRRCVAAALVFLERPGNDGLHVGAVRAMDRAEPCRLFFANHAHGIVQLPADGVGEFAGQQFIENDAQRVDVINYAEELRPGNCERQLVAKGNATALCSGIDCASGQARAYGVGLIGYRIWNGYLDASGT